MSADPCGNVFSDLCQAGRPALNDHQSRQKQCRNHKKHSALMNSLAWRDVCCFGIHSTANRRTCLLVKMLPRTLMPVLQLRSWLTCWEFSDAPEDSKRRNGNLLPTEFACRMGKCRWSSSATSSTTPTACSGARWTASAWWVTTLSI